MTRASGARVWDEDGREYVDYVMALGAVGLGYGHPEVNRAAEAAIAAGVVGPLPPVVEEELAEALSAQIPWLEQVRFLKTGAEAVAAAVRLARVATARDEVLGCGYHGWLDWCQGATEGVPAAVRGLFAELPFNDVAAGREMIRARAPRLAAVVVEPVIVSEPTREWLQMLRAETQRAGAVLILDEIKTAYRHAAAARPARGPARALWARDGSRGNCGDVFSALRDRGAIPCRGTAGGAARSVVQAHGLQLRVVGARRGYGGPYPRDAPRIAARDLEQRVRADEQEDHDCGNNHDGRVAHRPILRNLHQDRQSNEEQIERVRGHDDAYHHQPGVDAEDATQPHRRARIGRDLEGLHVVLLTAEPRREQADHLAQGKDGGQRQHERDDRPGDGVGDRHGAGERGQRDALPEHQPPDRAGDRPDGREGEDISAPDRPRLRELGVSFLERRARLEQHTSRTARQRLHSGSPPSGRPQDKRGVDCGNAG